ncbi:MAG: hypothetical protein R6X35_11585 [Candidatus Krumholzibacteriia bacterium]
MLTRTRAGLFVVFAAWLAAGITAADTCHDYGEGITSAATVSVSRVTCSARLGERELLGTSDGLLIVMDLADPFSPVLEDTLVLGAAAKAVVVAAGRAYVAASTAGLVIVDVSATGAPQVLGSYDTAGSAYGVAVVGATAYVADYSGGVVVLDVADPTDISLLGTFAVPDYALKVEALGDFVVVQASTSSSSGIYVLDLGDPQAGTVTDQYEAYGATNDAWTGLTRVGNTLAVVHLTSVSWGSYPGASSTKKYSAGFRSLDAGGAFVDQGGFGFPYETVRFQTCLVGGGGGVAAIGRNGEVVLVDMASGREVGVVPVPGLVNAPPTLADGVLVVASAAQATILVVAPAFAGAFMQTVPEDEAHVGARVGADATLAVESYVRQPLDDMELPITHLVARTVVDGALGAVVWSQTMTWGPLYNLAGFTPTAVVCRDAGTGAVSLRARDTGAELASLDPCTAIACSGLLVFRTVTGTGSDTLEIHDIADPAAPQLLGSLTMPAGSAGLAVDGARLYVRNGTPQVQVVDVTDPEAPIPVGTADYPWPVADLAVRDGLGIVLHDAMDARELVIADLGSAVAPALLGSTGVPTDARLVAPRDGRVFLISSAEGVVVVDISDHAMPTLEGSLRTGGSSLTVTDGILVAASPRGLKVLAPPCDATVPVLLRDFAVQREGDRVTVSWSLSAGSLGGSWRVLATSAGRSWLVPVAGTGSAFRAVDTVAAVAMVSYAVQLETQDGWSTLATGTVDRGTPAVALALEPASPNPFNPRTRIGYSIAEAGHVLLGVYDLAGRRVATLIDEVRPAGADAVEWWGTDGSGRSLPAGVYAVRLVTGEGVRTEKITLLK